MSILGKSITLYLMDGDADGRWRATLSNWNGIAYKIPRKMLKNSEKISRIHTPGVYFLLGKDDDSEKQFVYVGEADDVLKRINQPHSFEKDKSYWAETIIFVTSDETLEKGHVKYLENRFYSIVTEAKRYIVKNGNTPTQSHMKDQIRDLLEAFIINAQLIMPALGHRVFEPLVKKNDNFDLQDNGLLYFIRNNGKGGKATGQITNEGFVVLKGSYIYPKIASYVTHGIRIAREKYASIIDANGILQEDIQFGSPSYAATFVCGQNSNGLIEWRNSAGISIKVLDNPVKTFVSGHIQIDKKITKDITIDDHLYLASKKILASGQVNKKGFIVFKGSDFNPNNAPSAATSIIKRRAKLIVNGKVKDNVFVEDVCFKSPSTAAACILGFNVNGRKLWKNASGKSLKDIKGN